MNDVSDDMEAVSKSKLEKAITKQMPNFQIPPTRSDKQKYFGNALINKFKENFETKVWFTPHFAIASFHVIFGQLPNIKNMRIRVGNNYEDCRIHLLLLQESGSGKGAGFSFVKSICDDLNLIFHESGDLTNASIAGSMSPQEDGQAELKPGNLDPRYNGGEGIDILASNEASQIIDTRSRHYDKNALMNLQKAMNPMGTADNVITKETGVSNQAIRFNSDVSLYLTTFKPERLFQTMTQTGFLQRVVLLYNPISLNDKWMVGQKHLDMLENGNVKSIDNSDIVTAMKYINSYYAGVDKLTLTSGAKQAFKDGVLPYIYRPLLKLETNTMHEVKKFTTRYQVLLYKLAWHHAMTRLSKTVDVEDVAYAKKIFLPLFKKLVAFMENEYIVDSDTKTKTYSEKQIIKREYRNYAESAGKKNPWLYKTELVKRLQNIWDVSREASRHRLERYISLFEVKTTKSGLKVLRLRESER